MVPAKGGDPSLANRQEQDPTLVLIRRHLREGQLPDQLTLECSCFSLIDNILFRIMPDGTLRLIPPTVDRHTLFEEAHAGKFGGHLQEHKVYSQLCRHYWWRGMRSDVASWFRACEVCASRQVGQSIRPPLVPVPVFDRVGVDVIQFVRSNSLIT